MCSSEICKKSDAFTVPGAAGVLNAYVNPHGVVHQTLTLRSVKEGSVMLERSLPTLADTWFPGYGWIIAYCKICRMHLGWRFCRFDAGEASDGRVPAFFGIRQGALVSDEEARENREKRRTPFHDRGGGQDEDVDDDDDDSENSDGDLTGDDSGDDEVQVHGVDS